MVITASVPSYSLLNPYDGVLGRSGTTELVKANQNVG